MDFKFYIYFLAFYIYNCASSTVQPEVTVLPVTSQLRVGEDFSSVCYLPGVTILDLVNYHDLEWYRNDTPISFMSSMKPEFNDSRYSVFLNTSKDRPDNLTSTLIIKGVKVSDSGKFVCKVGQKKAAVSLSVIATSKQPNVFVNPKKPIFDIGDTFVVRCNFPGITTIDMVSFYPVQWFKDGHQISFLSSMDESQDNDRIGVAIDVHHANNLSSILTIKNLTFTDEGMYTCRVKNKNDSSTLRIYNGEKQQSSEGDLQVLIVNDEENKDDFLALKAAKPLHIIFLEGHSIDLHCRLFDTPHLRNAEWFKDGRMVTSMMTTIAENLKSSNVKVSMSRERTELVYDLEIKNATLQDAGLYVCKVNDVTKVLNVSIVKLSATTTTTPTLPQRSDISCNADSIDTFVPISMLPSGAPLTWRDPTCSVTSNGTHMLSSIGLSQCGTTVTITKDNVEFENELKAQSTNSTAYSLIDFGEDAYVIPVKCIYPRTETPMTSYVPLQQHVRFYEKRYGHFDVDIMQYDSDKFSSAIQNLGTPRKVALNSELYVEVKLNDQFNNGLGIHIDKCIATPTSSPSDSTLYTLLTDGCPASQHVHLYNSPANKVRFGVRAFQFTSQTGSMVYIHCQTSMCQAGTPYCTSNCVTAGRRKRDVAPDQKSHLVSAGPFVLVADEQGTPIRMSSIVASVSAFVAVVACVVAIVGWTRKTRTTSTKEQGLL